MRRHFETEKIILGSQQRFGVAKGEPELAPIASTILGVSKAANVRVTADDSTKVPPLVFVIVRRPFRERASAHEFVVGRQEWPLQWALLVTDDVLPPAIGQETVIGAGNELRAV